MSDPFETLMSDATKVAAPPEGYWAGYATRLRTRLDDDQMRRARYRSRLVIAASATSAFAIMLTILFLKSAPVRVPAGNVVSRSEQPRLAVATNEPMPVDRVVHASSAEPLQPVPDNGRRSTTSVLPPAHPLRTGESVLDQADEIVATATIGDETLPLRASGADAFSAMTPAGSESPATVALRLTDYRLLRNGVEIARDAEAAAVPGGILWFAYDSGERFGISTVPYPGFRQSGVARGNLMTFQWDLDNFHWVSASTIVDGEMALWIARDPGHVARDQVAPKVGKRVPAVRPENLFGRGRRGGHAAGGPRMSPGSKSAPAPRRDSLDVAVGGDPSRDPSRHSESRVAVGAAASLEDFLLLGKSQAYP